MKAAFDPAIHDDNPPMGAALLAGMKPSRRGRPKLAAPKVKCVVGQLHAKTVEHSHESGPDWQTRANPPLGQTGNLRVDYVKWTESLEMQI